MGLQGKIWDYGITPCLKLGLQKSCLKLVFTGFQSKPNQGFQIQKNILNYRLRDYMPFEIGLQDCTPFEIGIMGLQDPPLQGPSCRASLHSQNRPLDI